MKINKTVLILAALAALSFTGCVTTHVEAGNVKLDRTALFNKTGIGSLEYDPATGKFKLTGYANDSTELAVAVTEAAVRGATQAQK